MADYNRQPIPNVFVVDLSFRYRYTKTIRGETAHTLEPYLLLRNFLDRQYAYRTDYTMPGFNVLARLKVGNLGVCEGTGCKARPPHSHRGRDRTVCGVLQRQPAAMVIATHDLGFAKRLCSRFVMLEK